MTRRLPVIFDKAERMEWALKLMCRHGRCEHFTTGIGECFRSGRSADAEYGADRACNSCIADYALHGHVRGKTITVDGDGDGARDR